MGRPIADVPGEPAQTVDRHLGGPLGSEKLAERFDRDSPLWIFRILRKSMDHRGETADGHEDSHMGVAASRVGGQDHSTDGIPASAENDVAWSQGRGIESRSRSEEHLSR